MNEFAVCPVCCAAVIPHDSRKRDHEFYDMQVPPMEEVIDIQNPRKMRVECRLSGNAIDDERLHLILMRCRRFVVGSHWAAVFAGVG